MGAEPAWTEQRSTRVFAVVLRMRPDAHRIDVAEAVRGNTALRVVSLRPSVRWRGLFQEREGL
eukprot:2963715-Alexandrium_andersonii.AAC.1